MRRTGFVTVAVAAAVLLSAWTGAGIARAFTDVPHGHPYGQAITELARRGVVAGKGGDIFAPDDPVYRAHFAKMIVGALGITPNASTNTRFTDLGLPDAAGYPHKYVQTAYDKGITYGTNSAQTLFAPWKSIRREQVVSMVVRAANNCLPGALRDPPAGAGGFFAGVPDPHGANLRVAHYNGLLEGLVGMGPTWSVSADATRGECAQILYNLLRLRSGGGLAQRKVVTEFFYWYDSVSGDHMSPLSLKPRAGRPFTWRDPGFFEAEFSDMIDAGIDIAACGFWPGEEYATGGLPNLVTALDRLRAEGKTPPGVAMFYETVPLWDRDLTTEAGKQYFYSNIKTFFSLVPQRHWGLIKGRPVVWLYDTGGLHISLYNAATFTYIRTHFQADFGVDPYIAVDRTWLDQSPIPIDTVYTWGVAYLGFQPRDAVAGVGPGYDDHLLPGRIPPTIVSREKGAYYERNLYYALASGKDILWLETWNEHHEASNINHTAEYGRAYIESTRRYVDMFKRGEVPAKPPGGPLSQITTISLQATEGGGSGLGLTLLQPGGDSGDGRWKPVQVAGREAWRTVGGGQGRYLYFSIDDDFAWFHTPVTVDVTIDYLDSRGNAGAPAELGLEYDSYEPSRAAVLADSYRYKKVVSLGTSGTWRTATVRLTGVRFANGQNGGADFRLWAGENRDLTIAKVTVTKVRP